MRKIGILTFHFSTNFGGVLQSYALYKYLRSIGVDVSIIDYVRSADSKKKRTIQNIVYSSGFRKNLLKAHFDDLKPAVLLKRVSKKVKYNRRAWEVFDDFRGTKMQLSSRVDEGNIYDILEDYTTIIVGSDQVWNPGRRTQKEYFLDFGESFKGQKISYAADSTTSDIAQRDEVRLKKQLADFSAISVRNSHTQRFVKALTEVNPPVVADPTLLWDFHELGRGFMSDSDPYILVYVLGKDISGSNRKAIEEIKRIYGDLKVYAIVIPTMKFNICDYADKVFYDLGPEEWLDMIRNATFVYTDSFHGTLFSLKFHKPFLAYYAEAMRATRFIDLAERYQIGRYIVSSVHEIEAKGSLLETPDFVAIDQLIEEHKSFSIQFLEEALGIDS